MIGHLSVGATPCEEECASVGSENYNEEMRKEAARYIAQLQRKFPGYAALEERLGFRIFVNKGFPHDMGTYHEVVVQYDNDDKESVEFAYNVERNLPAEWDDVKCEECGDVKVEWRVDKVRVCDNCLPKHIRSRRGAVKVKRI